MRFCFRRLAASTVLPLLAGCGGESSELPPPAVLPPAPAPAPTAAPSAPTAPVATAAAVLPDSKTLDPETAGPDEPLAGFAAVWADAPFFVDARKDAEQIHLASFDGQPRRERLGHTLPVQIRGTQGDFVEVSAPPHEETPGFSPNADAHCGWVAFDGPAIAAGATLFVRRSDLAPVLAANFEQTFDDGSSVRFLAGTPVLRTETGTLALAHTLPVSLSTKPVVRFAYAAVPAPLALRGESKHVLFAQQDLTLGGRPFSLAGGYFAPQADHVDPVAAGGDRVLFPLESRCSTLQVSVPRSAIRPYVPSALGRGGGVGFGLGGVAGAARTVLPAGTALRTKGGRVIAQVSREVDLDPKQDVPCIQLAFRAESRYLGAPKLATTPGSVEACAAKSSVVTRKGFAAGTGAGGIGFGGAIGSAGHVAPQRVGTGTPQAQGGLAPDQVRRVVVAHVGAIRACFEKEAQRDPSLRGRVTLKWAVDPDGAVPAASVLASTLGNPAVESCMVRQVRSWKFPSAQSTTAVSAYPFVFASGAP